MNRDSKNQTGDVGELDKTDSSSTAEAHTSVALASALTNAIRSLEVNLQAHVKALQDLRKKKGKRAIRKSTRTDLDTDDVKESPNEKRTVYIRVVFLKIGEIDTVKENYAAEVFVQACWREPELDGKTDSEEDSEDEEVDIEQYWSPKLYLDNILNETRESLWHQVAYQAGGEAYVYEKRRVKATFLENMELKEFPFDTQDLSICIMSEHSETEVELSEDESEISSINIQSFVDEQEWRLHNHVETWNRIAAPDYKNAKKRRPAFFASCRARRRAGFFLWNILLVMLFICSLSFATFSVDMELPQNRLQLSFTLVLTTIAFKFVANQSLPKISYLTYLDTYILTSMAILCSICVWHSVIPITLRNTSSTTAHLLDHVALALIGGIYIIFHIVFFFHIYFVSFRRRMKFHLKDEEHQEKLAKLFSMKTLTRISPFDPFKNNSDV